MSKLFCFSLWIALLCLVGCSVKFNTNDSSADTGVPEINNEALVPEKETSSTEKQPADDPKPKPEVAKVGVGEKGRNYGGGLITEPASQYWKAKERIAFKVQIPKAMQLYKATNGKAPKTHEEFMEKIIKPGRINLPMLPPGRRYVYDPKTEKLMVERQKP